ncbi:MAG: hypothetical protein KGL39_43235 [Patescibacteria group bacterium]|nr:hypothetical protein [Patescibacteria group bacterium]
MRRGMTVKKMRERQRQYRMRYRPLVCVDCGKPRTYLCRDCRMLRIAARTVVAAPLGGGVTAGSVECRGDWIARHGA